MVPSIIVQAMFPNAKRTSSLQVIRSRWCRELSRHPLVIRIQESDKVGGRHGDAKIACSAGSTVRTLDRANPTTIRLQNGRGTVGRAVVDDNEFVIVALELC